MKKDKDIVKYHTEFKPAYNDTWRNVRDIECKVELDTPKGKRLFYGVIKEKVI